MSLTYAGLYVMLAGTFLVQTLGFSEACSNEITSKTVEWAPLTVGAIISAIGRWRLGGVSFAGVRNA